MSLALAACSSESVTPASEPAPFATDGGTPDSADGGAADATPDAPSDAATSRADGGVNADAAVAAYNPCPAAGAPCVVMPLGDSITYGIASSAGGGYRIELLRKARAAGHAITFVGYESSGPDTLDGQPFPKSNEGHSGYTIDDAPSVGRTGISSLIVDSLKLHKPHIVSLMIGTNDIDQNNDVANAPARLGRLLDTIAATSPDALIVVAQITPTGDDDENIKVRAYNAAIPALVEARKAAGKHILLVDMYGPFTANASYKTALMDDYLHPNDAGFVVMAGVWYAAIGGLFR